MKFRILLIDNNVAMAAALQIRIRQQNQRLAEIYARRCNHQLHADLRAAQEAHGLPAIIKFGRHAKAKVRRIAAKELRDWIGDDRASEALIRLLRDQDDLVRWLAALSLSERPSQENLPQLRQLLETQQLSMWMLASIMQRQEAAPEIKPCLLEATEAASQLRSLAVTMLGKLNDHEAILRFAQDPSAAVRDTVFSTLLPTSRPETLARFQNDQDPFIRQRVARLLDRTQPKLKLKGERELNLLTACLYAEAIGDSLGAPVEFFSLAEIRELGQVTDYLQAPEPERSLQSGDYTDDFQMVRMLLNSLDRAGRVDPNDLAGEFASFCLELDLGLTPDRGWSPRTLTTYRNLAAGLNWRQSALPTNGCAPATTVAPLPLLIKDKNELIAAVTTATIMTKTGPHALAGALASAHIIHQACWSGLPSSPEEIIRQTADFVQGTSNEMAEEIARLTSLLALPNDEALHQIPHHADGKNVKVGRKALGVVPSAIYCFVKTLTDLEATVLAAVNTEGDSDSIAALAGAMSAAYNGLEAIPIRWITGLRESQEIAQLARAFQP